MRVLLLLLLPSPAFACAMYIPREVVAQRPAPAPTEETAKAPTPAPTLDSIMADIDAAAAVPAPTTIPEVQAPPAKAKPRS